MVIAWPSATLAQLIEDRLTGQRLELGDELEAGESRRSKDRASATRSSRCQAVAVRSWETPMSSLGSDMCRLKKVRTAHCQITSNQNRSSQRASRCDVDQGMREVLRWLFSIWAEWPSLAWVALGSS